MSVWVPPSTYTNTTLSAAALNSGTQTQITWLKAALDNITGSTDSDVAGSTVIDVRRAAATDPAFRSGVAGATNPEFQIDRNGRLAWGPGGAGAVDSFLSRASAALLRLTGNTGFDVQWDSDPATAVDVFTARVAGASVARVLARMNADGGAVLAIRTNTASGLSMAYDATNTRSTINGNANLGGLEITGISGSPTASPLRGGIVMSESLGGAVRIGFDLANIVMWFSTDTSITRTAAGKLAVPRLTAAEGFVAKLKAGAPVDADFAITAESGLGPVIDTTNSRVYFRVGATWKFAALT